MNAKAKKTNKDRLENFNKSAKVFKEKGEEIENKIDNELNNLDEDSAKVEVEEISLGDKLKEELEESKNRCVDYLDKLKRNMAEFDNFRKRTMKEKAGMYDEGVKDTVEKLVPVLDNFELALNASMNKDDNFYKGIEMILRQFQSVLTDCGVEEISAIGNKFDPNIHNAVTHVSDEAFEENEIIEDLRKGYKYKDKVIRHSMVKVAN